MGKGPLPQRRLKLVRLALTLALAMAGGLSCVSPAAGPVQAGRGSSSAQAVAPRDEIAAGRMLVELRPGITLAMLGGGKESRSNSESQEQDCSVSLGGVALRLLRPIVESSNPRDSASGPIYLFALAEHSQDNPAATWAALSQVARDSRVRGVEPDRVRHASALPNDPYFSQQWNLNAIRVPAAWEISQGSAQVVVAVLDTGIIHGHPDLEARLVPGYDFISDPESADDGDNLRDADPTDTGTIDSSRLHGTHVSGIIGAITDNRLGIAGVDRACRLMPVRVLGVRDGDGVDSDIADAVRWAVGLQVGKLPPPAKPADVLNLSFGGPTTSFTLQRAVNDAIEQGAIVVAAAGNGGADTLTYSPGGLDGVISVGASTSQGQRADYSNYGPRVDLLAPGGGANIDADSGVVEGVLSTYRDEGLHDDPHTPYTYSQLAGTSQATPHVSGAAALSRAISPRLSQRSLGALLAASANAMYRCDHDPLGGCGAGLLDVAALLGLVRQQGSCRCSGEQVCLDGKTCTDPPIAHPPLVPDNDIQGGWCQLVGHRGSSGATGWILFLALGLIPLRRRWQKDST